MIKDYVGSDTDIVIPSGAFFNVDLEELILHEGLEVIGEWAFAYNTLTKIEIPSSVEFISYYAFGDNNIEQAIIKAENIVIWEDAFDGNQTNPKNLTIFGYKGSDVETFANDKGFTFKPLGQLELYSNVPHEFSSEELVKFVNREGEVVEAMQMPEFDELDLLASARLLISEVNSENVNAKDELEIAGHIVDILFVSPEYDPQNPDENEILNDEINNLKEKFVLSLRVNDDATGDIAMYHEIGDGDWDNVGGNIANSFVTATVTDFSKYGVFAKKESEEPEIPEEPTEPEEPEFDPCESQDPIAAGCPEDKIKDDIEDETTVTVIDTEKQTPKKGTLPNTATNRYNLLLLGGIMLVSGITLIFCGRRRRQIIDKN